MRRSCCQAACGHLILRNPLAIVHKVLNIGGLATLIDGSTPDSGTVPSQGRGFRPQGPG